MGIRLVWLRHFKSRYILYQFSNCSKISSDFFNQLLATINNPAIINFVPTGQIYVILHTRNWKTRTLFVCATRHGAKNAPIVARCEESDRSLSADNLLAKPCHNKVAQPILISCECFQMKTLLCVRLLCLYCEHCGLEKWSNK